MFALALCFCFFFLRVRAFVKQYRIITDAQVHYYYDYCNFCIMKSKTKLSRTSVLRCEKPIEWGKKNNVNN